MIIAFNIDLLFVGLAVAGSVILGFLVYLRDTTSITNRFFLFFTLSSATLGIINYISYQPTDLIIRLWLIRSVMFLSVLQSAAFFLFILVFPRSTFIFPLWRKRIFLFVCGAVALLTLSPYVFSGIQTNKIGQISQPIPAPGIFFFALVTISLVVGGIMVLFYKMVHAAPEEKAPFRNLLAGAVLMFTFILGFNFIFPAFLGNTRFIPFNAAFTLPFAVFTFYAIVRYQLLNIRVIAAEVLMLLVVCFSFFEIVFARGVGEIVFRVAVFGLLLVFGVLLIRSVRREVEQREHLQTLSNQLAAANEELKKLDAAKSEFISIASHQLRAPLTVIKGYISLALEGTLGKLTKEMRASLEKMGMSTEQLVKLISSILDLSRMESGRMTYEMVENNLGKVIEELIGQFKQQVREKGLDLTSVRKNEVPSFSFDRDKIREVVLNLIHNAVKYTQKGKITVEQEIVTKGGREFARISVEDNGMGIKKEDLPRLFIKFNRSEEARLVDPNGMGIGLYFVKRVVEDHDGTTWAESAGPGKGSTFVIELPLKNRSHHES